LKRSILIISVYDMVTGASSVRIRSPALTLIKFAVCSWYPSRRMPPTNKEQGPGRVWNLAFKTPG